MLVLGPGFVFLLVPFFVLDDDLLQASGEARCDAIVLLSSLSYASPGHASSFL